MWVMHLADLKKGFPRFPHALAIPSQQQGLAVPLSLL